MLVSCLVRAISRLLQHPPYTAVDPILIEVALLETIDPRGIPRASSRSWVMWFPTGMVTIALFTSTIMADIVSAGPEDGPAVTRSAQQVAANKTDPTYSGSSNGSRVTNLELTHPYDHTPPLPPCRSLTPETSPTHLADDNILAGAHNADDDPCLEIIHDSEHKPNGEIVQGEMTSLTLQTASSYLREPSPTQGETSMTIPDPLNLTISASESSLSNAGPPTDTLLSPLSSGLPQSHHMYLPVLQTAFTVISTHNDDIPQHESLYPDPGAAVSGPPSEYPKTTFSSSLQWRPLRGGLRSVDPASRENFPSDSLLAVASGDIVPLLRASSSSTGRESQRLWPERSDITPCNRVDALSEDDMLASTDSGYASPTKHRLAAVKSTRRSSYKRSIHRSMPLPDYDAPPSTALMPYSM
ncbi:hypothetical protein JAAARDRAFT_637926 [Jaapia argillacea MUCL 33604]|uniref:Uncharacterized protein n=1 Tax=Jaapia argillacea MUCL 33604 TaxID=933084 RepID=A0A067QBL1_9AGAM|nr:hypothetical protein JAAARDRAFT_637926 [Jaapia argillacea MUCL 33604]